MLSNSRAPLNTVGIYTNDSSVTLDGGTGYYVYNAVFNNPNDPNDPNNGKLNQQPLPQRSTGCGTIRPLQSCWATHSRRRPQHASWTGLQQPGCQCFKTVPVTERVNLQLQLNAYNVLNHQFYGTPDVTVEDFTPGSPTSSFLNLALINGGNIRTLQLGGKITF